MFAIPPELLPRPATIKHYLEIVGEGNFLSYLKNSILVTLISCTVSMAVGILAAYGFAKFSSKTLKPVFGMTTAVPVSYTHLAGIIRLPQANLNAVRAGITIYGIYPSKEVERTAVRLLPAMELKSHVSFVKTLPAGRAISYGGTFVTKRDTVVETIPVGYADGYPRSLSNRGWVLIRGKKAPILGRVCICLLYTSRCV